MARSSPHLSNNDLWDVWIDTGGTFTDCLARRAGSDGELHGAKVLSTGALRGIIKERIDSHRLIVNQNWNGCDDLIAGFQFRLGHDENQSAAVKRFDARSSVIELAAPWPDVPMEGRFFEVRGSEPAPILAARLVTGTPAGVPMPRIRMRLATTRGTNALLERRGAPTALFITQGFGDLLRIGNQQRPDLFALNIQRPPPLCQAVVEVHERLNADGSVLTPLDTNDLDDQMKRIRNLGIDSAAVALMHSYLNDAHERAVAESLRKSGFRTVVVSSELSPLIRLLPRAQTAAVEAYLEPVISEYLKDVQSHLVQKGRKDSTLHVMTSSGGLVATASFRANESLLSGPAAGVAGAAFSARQSGFHRAIGFDMGGTSTDVARYDGDFEYRFEHQIAGVQVLSPTLAIETVAAGGGSICDCVDGAPTIGPHSAGADPGPACYGAGGPDASLTLTDVNLVLGRLTSDRFEIPIDPTLAMEAAGHVLRRIKSNGKDAPIELDVLLWGFLQIANERMASAIERISVRQGVDAREYAMVAFGGAGGQHACAVADRLGIQTVIMPAHASLLSAAGLGQACIERFAQRQILQPLAEVGASLQKWFDDLGEQARSGLTGEGIDRDDIAIRRLIANLRLLGQDSTLSIDLVPTQAGSDLDRALRDQFQARYRTMYGHEIPMAMEDRIEVESIRVVASTARSEHVERSREAPTRTDECPPHSVRAYFADGWLDIPAFERSELALGTTIAGPALVMDRHSTCVIEPEWSAALDLDGALIARRANSGAAIKCEQPEMVDQELFSNRLSSIADEMGQLLQRTALSTNVKERLDFSCAILNADGELIVNAPHIPVHLGALGACVRAVREMVKIGPEDVVITNHPAYGGSHLPDVTVITPVYVDHRLVGYVANRAHHAEIGGTRPGSMPPAATTLAEEGIVIEPQLLVHAGRDRFEAIERLLTSGPNPSRAVADNMADLRAAVAANRRGADAIQELIEGIGVEAFSRRMAALTLRADQLTRDALSRLGGNRISAIERLDDGSPICVDITVNRRQDTMAVFDFSGSAAVHAGNLNATPAIVRSAVMYVLRLLIGQTASSGKALAHLPLNEGILRPCRITIPTGMLNPHFTDDPMHCPAVVGGNTETSQRVVDVLLKALNLAACSQGTMNNILFGNDRFGYYETVCGGSGASPGFHGECAVQTHMTNTRITDPEIIEYRYPARVDRFTIRRGSGGNGAWRGGDGAVREFTFLQPMALSVLTQHRVERPFGMNGGGAGSPGIQRIDRSDGKSVPLQSIDQCDVMPGDRLIVETPGGGGCGIA